MYRSHNCGELRISDLNKQVELSGWVQKVRDKGFIMWVDIRDRYGITQLIFDQERTSNDVVEVAKTLGREFVINVKGSVIERNSKNSLMNTGDVEVLVSRKLSTLLLMLSLIHSKRTDFPTIPSFC